MPALEYVHVDVFSSIAYSGNSLPVFLNAGGLSSRQMLRITQELRHFEAIFLEPPVAPNTVQARVFDLFDKTVSVAPTPSGASKLCQRVGAGHMSTTLRRPTIYDGAPHTARCQLRNRAADLVRSFDILDVLCLRTGGGER